MNNKTVSAIICSLFFLQNAVSQNNTQQSGNVIQLDARVSRMDYVPGVMLVKFKDVVTANSTSVNGLKKVGVTSVDALLEKYQAKTAAKLFPSAQPLAQKKLLKTYTGQTIEQPNLHNIYKIELTDATKLIEAIEAFKQDASVEFAEPNYICSIVDDKPVSGVLTETDARNLPQSKIANLQSAIVPNDPLYSQQWYIPAVQADAVWVTTEGDTSQVIAFLDTGVDWHHPDLVDNIWTNTAEVNGVAGVDDDHDGFVDDVHGWDFINNDNDPSDDNSHGTHVAGIACAKGNNGIGIAGVNWHAKIMPVKVFQSSGRGDAATISQGINYAANKGATVINMSFGSYARSLTMEAALQNAYANCILVAAAGNDGVSIGPGPFTAPFYPAALSYVLGVQATQQTVNQTPGDKQGTYLTDFTNYDKDGPVYSGYSDLLNYEIKAPGDGIISTVPNGGYRIYSGTSMATPVVAGAVALYKTLHPDDSQELMWGNLINTTAANINILNAMNVHASPVLSIVSNTIVDTLAGDNNNGLVDAGETVQLWFTVRNTWGQSDSVFMGLRLAQYEDTSVAHILNSTVFMGSISPYAKRTNEHNPITIQIGSKVANNRDIVLEGLLWYTGSVDTIKQMIVLNVKNAIEISGLIDSNLTLTPDKNYIITGNTVVNTNDTLFIMPGTKISFLDGKILNIWGTVLATGKKDSVIEFFPESNYIGGIEFNNGIFMYCTFNGIYAVSRLAINIHTKGQFENCIFENNYSNWDIFPVIGGVYPQVSLDKCNYFNNTASFSQFYPENITINNSNFINNNLINEQSPFILTANPVKWSFNNIYNNKPYDLSSWWSSAGVIYIDTPFYYGTSNLNKIKSHIGDYFVSGQGGIISLRNFSPVPSSSAHGIVWKVLVDGIDPQDQKNLMNPIGVGHHRFDVYFNRPMDTTYTPQLSFGVRDPFTQQSVSDSARWSPDHNTWTAYKTIKLYTGDGVNTIRVASARDPEGFDIPVENMRFNFLIDAAGTSSVDFTAMPGLGKINLEWNNTGLVDFLGFNMYRFTNKTDTTYTDTTLINTKLITDTLYTDYSVVPGKKYYYLYKVIRTDFSESSYSRMAGATALTSSPGDANGDLAVNVLDIVSVVSYILGGNPQPFIFAAADVNHDSTINVLDVVGTVNIILHPQPKIANNKTAGSAHLDLISNTISLSSDAPVSAIQFRMVGKGLKDMQFTPGAALSQFEIASNPIGDTARIFLIYSMKGLTLAQGTTMLGTFAPTPAQATITNAIISDAQGHNILTNVFENGKPLIPTEYSLEQNYPNPFNLSTQIQYALPEKARGQIIIYNLLGQKVRTFDLNEQAPGRYMITWDGRTQNGIVVSSGVYFYRFETDKFKQTKKLVLIK